MDKEVEKEIEQVDDSRSRQKAMVGLLLQHQRAIYAYIYSLVPHKADADDILQETCLTIHEKFDDFQLGTNFLSWANRIAYWKVRQARQKFARSKVIFNDELFELVANTSERIQSEESPRHEALATCMKKLKERDRAMIWARFESADGVEEAARVSNRSIQATYKALFRVKSSLLSCIQLQMSKAKGALSS